MKVKRQKQHRTSASQRERAGHRKDHAHRQVQPALVPQSLMTPVPSVWAT